MLLTPRRMSVSPVCVLASPFCLCGGPVEWRGVVCCCVVPVSRVIPVLFAVFPVFGLGLAPCIVLSPFTLSCSLVSFSFLFCFVLSCLLWVGRCGGMRRLHTSSIVVRVSVCCVMAVHVLSCRIVLWVVDCGMTAGV